jgi:hypothetical protein
LAGGLLAGWLKYRRWIWLRVGLANDHAARESQGDYGDGGQQDYAIHGNLLNHYADLCKLCPAGGVKGNWRKLTVITISAARSRGTPADVWFNGWFKRLVQTHGERRGLRGEACATGRRYEDNGGAG